MTKTTQGIALRAAPFSRTSHVVTWLTRDYGRLATVIKGARRPKSAFLGQYDLFYTCELVFYQRETAGLHVARECAPISSRSTLRRDWRGAACASYACDVMNRVVMPGQHAPELFRICDELLDVLCERGTRPESLFHFELRLLGALGLAPRLARCASCDATVGGDAPLWFSCGHGGVVCAACSEIHLEDRGTSEDADGERVGRDVVAVLADWQAPRDGSALPRVHASERQVVDIERLLGTFLTYHLHMAPLSRSIALQMVRLP